MQTYILNVSGGHGHFLQWLLDRSCVDTPAIDTLPFNHLGASHKTYEQSGHFIFIDDLDTGKFLNSNIGKNAVMITIEDEILYWERSCLFRAGNAGTDLFDEKSIEEFLIKQSSTFPEYCKSKGLSIKDGYMYAFKNVAQSGARLYDNDRKKIIGIKNNNVHFLPISNFLDRQKLKKSLIDIGKKFKFELDLSNYDEAYGAFYHSNTILQTSKNIELYLAGDTSIKLDVLQQAYVDAQHN